MIFQDVYKIDGIMDFQMGQVVTYALISLVT